MTMVKVQAGQSILEGYIRTPLRGLTELIWNAFDEDAHLVTITCERNPLEGLNKTVVSEMGPCASVSATPSMPTCGR